MNFSYFIFLAVSLSFYLETSAENEPSDQQHFSEFFNKNIEHEGLEQKSNLPNFDNVKSVKIENGYTGILLPQNTIDKAQTYLEAVGISKGYLEYVKTQLSKIAKHIFKYAIKIGTVVATGVLIILITSSIANAFCSYSELCSLQSISLGWEDDHLNESVRSLLTQDKISKLSSFVHNAINKYTSMQQKKSKSIKH